MNKERFFISLLFLIISTNVPAQNVGEVLRDTLPASLKIAEKVRPSRADGYVLEPLKTIQIVSPLGEGDVVKYIQTLPGVATGGEGGSAFYVRGGNMGSNLMTLDGVPVYGISHLMGMTTVYPPDVIGSMEFHAGGFSSEEGNFTASHIRLKTKEGDYSQFNGRVSITPFLAGASLSTPIVKDKLSFIGSFRISPVGLEYQAARGIINRNQHVLQDFGATVGDAFGKLSWRPNPCHTVSLTAFGSMDKYAFILTDQAKDGMGWSNLIANLSWDFRGRSGLVLHSVASINEHNGNQEQETTLNGIYNRLQVRSTLDELTLHSTVSWQRKKWSFQTGLKMRGARYNPGSAHRFEGGSLKQPEGTPLANPLAHTMLATLHGQVEYADPERFLLRLAMRGNGYWYDLGPAEHRKAPLFHPEASLTARIHATRHIGLEATGDYLTQYNHTLEGLPLGMSLDMIVPSDDRLMPEQAWQGYGGFFGVLKEHSFRAGGFYKQMHGLVYYGDATSFFSSAQSGWRDNISIGEGRAYGMELLYEKNGEMLSWRTAYTLSRTDRHFPDLNHGRPFPAKYDRRHIANASLDWTFLQLQGQKLTLNTLFTYQSGSWETLQDGSIPAFLIGQQTPTGLPFASAFNNYQLPAFIRWDASLLFEIQRRQIHYEISAGLYNILNRHNPFMLRYNPDTKEWNTVSLFPVMPVLSIRISFNRS